MMERDRPRRAGREPVLHCESFVWRVVNLFRTLQADECVGA
jgi:hypothetical protein